MINYDKMVYTLPYEDICEKRIRSASGTRKYTIDAIGIALEVLGRPIVNTIMLGALAGATGEVTIESIIKIKHSWGKLGKEMQKLPKKPIKT